MTNICVQENNYVTRQTAMLMETFPTVCEQEVLQCLAIAKGKLNNQEHFYFTTFVLNFSTVSHYRQASGNMNVPFIDETLLAEIAERINSKETFWYSASRLLVQSYKTKPCSTKGGNNNELIIISLRKGCGVVL